MTARPRRQDLWGGRSSCGTKHPVVMMLPIGMRRDDDDTFDPGMYLWPLAGAAGFEPMTPVPQT
jgi:hypothetical protein